MKLDIVRFQIVVDIAGMISLVYVWYLILPMIIGVVERDTLALLSFTFGMFSYFFIVHMIVLLFGKQRRK